jgi:parallel beta-helix repeat protein
VPPGTYHENIVIDKLLILIGDVSGANRPVIDGDGNDGIETRGWLSSYPVVIQGFEFTDTYNGVYARSPTEISYCYFHDNSNMGVNVYQTSHVNISYNVMKSNYDNVYLESSPYTNVSNNTFG